MSFKMAKNCTGVCECSTANPILYSVRISFFSFENTNMVYDILYLGSGIKMDALSRLKIKKIRFGKIFKIPDLQIGLSPG